MEEILIPITFFLVIFGIMYVYYTTRNRERLAMIEKGTDPQLFKNALKNQGKYFGRTTMLFACLFMGVGLGILFGSFIESTGLDQEISYTASIFLFGGLGLLISIFASRSLFKDEKEK